MASHNREMIDSRREAYLSTRAPASWQSPSGISLCGHICRPSIIIIKATGGLADAPYDLRRI